MLEAPAIARSEPPELTAEQLLEAARLVAVGGIAGEVVHELNNPLFAILGLVEMLLGDAEPGSKEQHRLALVHQTGIEMRQLVRALGDFARPSDEGIGVADLGDVVARAVELTGRTAATKDVDVVVRAAALPLPVRCSSAHLAAVVVDLLTKVRRALPRGGTVEVALARQGDAAVAHIAAEGEVVSLEPSTGIGVAVDAAAVHALGGTLTHGPGAEFSVHLPLDDEETAS